MSNYRLTIENPIPLVLLIPTNKNINGVLKKNYPTVEKSLSVKDKNGNEIWVRNLIEK